MLHWLEQQECKGNMVKSLGRFGMPSSEMCLHASVRIKCKLPSVSHHSGGLLQSGKPILPRKNFTQVLQALKARMQSACAKR